MAVPRSVLLRAVRIQSALCQPRAAGLPRPLFYRQFHASRRADILKPFLLADIGEGITECQLIQWFVQPGARVEQFDKICEVQSDKASVEITSPFDGVIKKLYYEPDDMAITGKPLVDIDIEGEISDEDAAQLGGEGKEASEGGDKEAAETPEKDDEGVTQEDVEKKVEVNTDAEDPAQPPPASAPPAVPPESGEKGTATAPVGGESSGEKSREMSGGKGGEKSGETGAGGGGWKGGEKGTLATPAVRRITKEHNINIADVQGTGKDGRVLKEDVQKYVSQQGQPKQKQPAPSSAPMPSPAPAATKEDRKVTLTPVQSQMFKTMTKALNIPHFLYSTTADMGSLTSIRQKLNAKAQSPDQKVTHLSFILKALSLALQQHPLLNSSLNASDPKKPELTHRGAHNFGVAIDAPSGLLVPVVKNVQNLTIAEIASTLRQLGEKARNNKLAPGDFSGVTFTVSNIGSVGGGVVAPVISEPQVAIMAIGRSKIVPAFDENDELVKKEELVLSWSADHRVVDGAECARCAERVRGYLEDPGSLLVGLR